MALLKLNMTAKTTSQVPKSTAPVRTRSVRFSRRRANRMLTPAMVAAGRSQPMSRP